MIYNRRKYRTVWVGVVLLLIFVFTAIFQSGIITFPIDGGANFPGKVLEDVHKTTEFFERLESNIRKLPVDAEKIVESINFLNEAHDVLNSDRFGPPTQSSVSYVIVVQVHKRLEYLVHLVKSLRGVTGIRDVLLIFSHDFNDESINVLIRSIDFCRVIQIFYPYNIQLFPNVFPGQNPQDCPLKATKQQAATCKNGKYPDKYGNYRISTYTQIKHHWWWKMNYVFEEILKRYELNHYVILLEEDHFLMPDSLHVLKKMIEIKTICKSCQIFCLGAYLKNYKSYKDDIAKLSIAPWFSSKHNMGMVINAETWEMIRKCSEMFCTFDDYNWDWSLLLVTMKCLPNRPSVIFNKSPRVIHIGDCGVHANRCEPHDAASSVLELIGRHRELFFPSEMKLAEISKRSLKPSKPNGGWGDIRDHALCLLNSRKNYSFVAPNQFKLLDSEDSDNSSFVGKELVQLDLKTIIAILD